MIRWHVPEDVGAYTVPEHFAEDWLNEFYDEGEGLEDDYRYAFKTFLPKLSGHTTCLPAPRCWLRGPKAICNVTVQSMLQGLLLLAILARGMCRGKSHCLMLEIEWPITGHTRCARISVVPCQTSIEEGP